MSNDTAARGGRPRQFDLDDATDSAMQLFWRNGYARTTTRDLEATLGINQSSLYHAFGSKAGLLVAAVTRYRAGIDTALLVPLRASTDPTQGLETFFRDVGTWTAQDARGCLMVNLMTHDDGSEPVVTQQTAEHRAAVRAALLDAVIRQSPGAGGRAAARRADLLLAATLGINVAARSGAAAVRPLVDAARAQVRAWAPTPRQERRG